MHHNAQEQNMASEPTSTTQAGIPAASDRNSLTVGPNDGPVGRTAWAEPGDG